jgi:hypothetical protein
MDCEQKWNIHNERCVAISVTFSKKIYIYKSIYLISKNLKVT